VAAKNAWAEKIICLEQIKKRNDLAQRIYNWCVEHNCAHMIKHIRISLDATIRTTTCVVFIYLFDFNDETIESLQLALVQVEDNLQVAVQTPTQVYWSRNSPRGIADTVTVTKTSDNPKVQQYSTTEVLNYVPLLRVLDHASQPQVRLEQVNNSPAQPVVQTIRPIDFSVQSVALVKCSVDSNARPKYNYLDIAKCNPMVKF